MPLSDAARLSLQVTAPRALTLWRALHPLRGLVRFMNTGAHPDDETSAMLAALSLRDGISLSYACSTRGEGGQNDLGREAGADLGTLRTAEMERACDVLNLSMYWLSEGPDDTITDFGFSKSGVETLGKWDHARTLRRFVEIIRADRPDIICPTFLDIPGQHGHHRAMTQAAHEVMDAAADPAFEAAGAPWQVAKLYLPAWSGAGDAYDDDLPPPPETLRVPGHGVEGPSGWTWAEIGQHSRVFHATQGMGRWVGAAETAGWPLHLARTFVGPDGDAEGAITDNLARSYADLVPGAGAFADLDAALAATVAAYPDPQAVALRALDALRALHAARAACPAAASGQVLHRLDRHEAALARVLMLAAGIRAEGRLSVDFARPGSAVTGQLSLHLPDGAPVQARLDWDLPPGWRVETDGTQANGATSSPNVASEGGTGRGTGVRAQIHIPGDAPPADPYPTHYSPDGAAGPVNMRLTLSAGAGAVPVKTFMTLPTERRLLVLPKVEAEIAPAAVFVNSRAAAPVTLHLSDGAALSLPEGWALRGPVATPDAGRDTGAEGAAPGTPSVAAAPASEPAPDGLRLIPPARPEPGLWALPVTLDGVPAQSVTRIDYSHTGPRLRAAPALLRLRVADVALPLGRAQDALRVGYIGGGNDRADHWLRAMGVDVVTLDDAGLTPAALARCDALVIGIFALRFRRALAGLMPAVHDWVHAGGTLLTLYHRPWDNWDATRTAPAPLEIGKPSLRFRVTDEGALVRHLAPDHPVLTGPNPIGPQDWDGWVKERGLYFAKSWDAAYTPLLEMADHGEAPHHGALVSAEIGAGRHTHCALIVHLQMEALIPGAFRLMANMIAPR
ncbi:PIG-L family deacetylase [Roseicitreum antarcticum]|uniref:N-acetylglucosaminyl deacetylase, LmbE family n=1 Tax=Roseicitreum antarcticum TaxID=564137 RepID=A0A1H2XQI3_9RHOB|nr:PIG-L family deacetylase [Roseicitreum antarcticum]SDW95067.1 N-acetylglucosaminyl deacetylase, LmbE family [Roseicitreum antarcticum]